MNGKHLVQIGTAVFVGLVFAMTLVQLREVPVSLPELPLAGKEADADPLAVQLRACSMMGEQALSSHDCRAAWAEKRRRFFGAAPSNAFGEREKKSVSPSSDADPTPGGSD